MLYSISFFNFHSFLLGLINDFITHSTESVLYSPTKVKDSYIPSPSKEISQKGEPMQV
jgi:hypothetical protein